MWVYVVEDLESDVPASAIVHSHVRALREREREWESEMVSDKKKGKTEGEK
jgi:hypothetical protein